MTGDPFYDGLPADEPEPDAIERVEVEMLPSAEWPPAGAELVAEFVVIGDAATAGSKTSGVVTKVVTLADGSKKRVPVMNPKTGFPKTFTKDSSGAKGKTWRQDVQAQALASRDFATPIDGRLAAEFTFVRVWKPGDYSKRDGRLRDAALAAPSRRPDALKLGRAVEDALAEILYTDDARITEERLRKVFVPPEKGPPRCEIRLWKLPTTIGEQRLAQLPTYEEPEAQESLAL